MRPPVYKPSDIAKKFPIKIKIKPSFWVLAAFSVLSGYGRYFFTILVLVILHELCHIFTAGIWGLKTRSITLTPIGAAADTEGLEGLHITKRMAIALAGPLFNLTLALFCTSAMRGLNLALALFNLLPVYPLDGGKILHYLAGYFMGVLRGNIFTVRLSICLCAVMIGAGMIQLILYPPNISLLCLGVYFHKLNKTGKISLTYAFYKTVIYKDTNRIMPVRALTTGAGMELKAVVYRLGWDYFTLVYIRNGSKLLTVNEEQLLKYILKRGLKGSMKEVAESV